MSDKECPKCGADKLHYVTEYQGRCGRVPGAAQYACGGIFYDDGTSCQPVACVTRQRDHLQAIVDKLLPLVEAVVGPNDCIRWDSDMWYAVAAKARKHVIVGEGFAETCEAIAAVVDEAAESARSQT